MPYLLNTDKKINFFQIETLFLQLALKSQTTYQREPRTVQKNQFHDILHFLKGVENRIRYLFQLLELVAENEEIDESD